MKMKPIDNLPDSFQARRYRPGTADADPVTAKVNSDHLVLRQEDGTSFNLALDDLDIKLGGSHGDRIVFTNATTGDTIVVRDVNIVKALKTSSQGGQLQKQVAKMQSTQRFQKVQRVFGIVAVVFVCFMFGGCVLIGVLWEPLRSLSEADSTKTKTEEESSAEQKPDAEQRAKIEQLYQKRVKSLIMKAWKLPPDNNVTNAIVVRTKIDEKGKVNSSSVSESSGDLELDNSAVNALKAASPLPAPPKFWPQPVEIEIVLNPSEKQSD